MSVQINTSNDHPFGCPVIYTDMQAQWYFIRRYRNNAWHNNGHFLMGRPCLTIIASNEWRQSQLHKTQHLANTISKVPPYHPHKSNETIYLFNFPEACFVGAISKEYIYFISEMVGDKKSFYWQPLNTITSFLS